MNAPPILVSFSTDTEKYLEAISPDQRILHEASIRRLVEKGFPPIASTTSVAVLFGFSSRFVGLMIKSPDTFYREFTIKKGAKLRTIQAPKVGLKIIQKWIASHLSRSLKFPKYVCGFVPGRSTVHGAYQHSGARWVYSIDVSDFFQTTSQKKIEDVFISLSYGERGAKIAASLCCLDGNLAQGAPSSPVLSNLAFSAEDSLISSFCMQRGFIYTRYADDIAISGKSDFDEKLPQFLNETIGGSGWKISEKKTSFSQSPNRLKVYGLLVHGDAPRLTKGYRKRLRAINHKIAHGTVAFDRVHEALGHISYAKSIDKHVSALSHKEVDLNDLA